MSSAAILWKYLAPRLRWMAFPVGLWVATRLSMLLLGYVSLKLAPSLRGSSVAALRPYPSLDALCCWDCGWYNRLAKEGFIGVDETNFWPGLPFAGRWLARLTGMKIPYAILTIPNLAALGAYLTLYRLFTKLDGVRLARAALGLFAAYPFAYYHASGYPETIMIFASALAVWLAMTNHHVSAGISLGLGIMSRHLTVLLGAGLLAAQLRQRGVRRFFTSPVFLTLALPFVIVGIYMVYSKITWGDPVAFWRARNAWGKTAWWSVIDAIRHVKTRPHVASFVPFALFPTVGAILLLRERKYAELAAAGIPLMVVLWAIGAFALGRYSASCWPAFLPLAKWLDRHPRWQLPVLLLFGLAQGWFFFLHSHHYEIQ
jgi:DNA-binding transcriptional ArsR family regulator